MLEIFILWKIAASLSRIATSKNRSKAWAALGVAMWIGGETVGFALAPAEAVGETWLLGIACGFVGVLGAFAFVCGLDRLPGPDDPIPAARIVTR